MHGRACAPKVYHKHILLGTGGTGTCRDLYFDNSIRGMCSTGSTNDVASLSTNSITDEFAHISHCIYSVYILIVILMLPIYHTVY